MTKYILFIAVFAFLLSAPFGNALGVAGQTNVKALVGEYTLNLTGFVSPNASIALSSNDNTLATTVADSQGNFSFSVVVKQGFDSFCLEAIDFKRVGDSYTCFKIPPAQGSVTKNDIFLPPTIALSGKKLTSNSSVFAYGYTMPNAMVDLNIGGGTVLKIKADSKGYYRVEIKDLSVGKYSLFATAKFEGKNSEKPDKKLQLESVSLGQDVVEKGQSLLDRFFEFLRKLINALITYIWIVIPAFILLIILLPKRVRDKIKRMLKRDPRAFKSYSSKGKRSPGEDRKSLHHYWMFGY